MSAIKNCTAILTDPHGKFRLDMTDAQAAFADLTLYTNAESCPMARIPSHILFFIFLQKWVEGAN